MRTLEIKIHLDKIEGNIDAQVNFILTGLSKGVMAARLLTADGDGGVALGDYHGKIVGKMEIIND